MKKKKNPHAVALGRKGGSATSPKKTAAVRRNAALARAAKAKKKKGRRAEFTKLDRPVNEADFRGGNRVR